ncbi:Ethanolamine utilization protein EutG [Brevibacterium casei]|uniref:Ethanolamine utilization protein EutG n=1 Tax=Brevibacterium casei TaxID=33889 RepID=A0A449D980_9MICO|nr:iron-containing alcohol dehydrogenase [Brevibacterium casei]VEW14119.1 Ethanolamine utilization protein EutG [Brevibacterium casei]
MSAAFRETTFAATTRIHAGIGILGRTAEILAESGSQHVLVVADRGLERIGVLARILDWAGMADRVVGCELVDVNPSPAEVDIAASRARALGADAVLAIGGGSGLSAAKAVALLMTNDLRARDLEGTDRADSAPAPTVAVPTTAGSGSEVSNALVLHEAGAVRETIIRGRGYAPVAAVLDARVLRGIPREPLVYAALDALTHALESLWSRGRSMFTDACALHAAANVFSALPEATTGEADGRNAEGRNDAVLQRLLEAASLANIACGNSGLALVHALSSSLAVDEPHGLQNGRLLPHIAAFNRDLVSAEARDLIDRIPALYDTIGFDPDIKWEAERIDAVLEASRGHPFRDNNIRESTDTQLRELLETIAPSQTPERGEQ